MEVVFEQTHSETGWPDPGRRPRSGLAILRAFIAIAALFIYFALESIVLASVGLWFMAQIAGTAP